MRPSWLLLLLGGLACTHGAVVQRVTGPDESEITHASAGGGVSVYLTGSALGTPFNPPTVLVGINGDAECVVQGFTSSTARLHCIINAAGLPPPTTYNSAGDFQDLPLYVIKDGKHADCWQVGGTNHGCFLRFDLGGTPRITQVKTAVLQASAFMRIGGSGIDGGLLGAPLAGAKLHREYLTKGPGSIKGDGTYVGCASRYDDTDSPSAAVALGHTDSSSYSCKVEALKGGLAAGFFNVSLEVFANHRGVAYHDAQRQVDIAGGLLFDAELVPRITAVSPRLGSLAGGTDVTITGAGFGSDSAALDVLVGGVPCAVSSMDLDGVVSTLTCRVAYRPAGAEEVAPMAAGRGARWRSGGTQMLLADLSTRAWASSLDGGGGATVEAWFEAPHTGAQRVAQWVAQWVA